MKMRLGKDCFAREAGGEGVWVCPKGEGGCRVAGGGLLARLVGRKWAEDGAVYKAMAEAYAVGADEVENDFGEVVETLVELGLLEAEGRAMGESVVERFERHGEEQESEGDFGEAILFWVDHGLPSSLHLDLTDGCNERCVHCYLPKGGAHFLDTGIAMKVLKEFREAQGLTVFVSGGECMLHRDFGAILRRARNLELNIVVMSNVALCDGKMVELLKEVEPQFVNVSLYAVTEAIHDGITQVPGSCRKTKAAIDALLAAGVSVRIATPFMRENKACVEELKAFARERGIHLIPDAEIFGPIDHSCSNRDHALPLDELERLVSGHKDVFAKECAEAERCVPDAKVCDIGDARLNLDAEGRYYPCDGFHGAIIGDARTDSRWEVWTGEALNRLRALKNRDFGECASCEDRAWCKVCPMRNFNETGDMFTHAPWRCGAARVWRWVFGEDEEGSHRGTETQRGKTLVEEE